MRRAVLLFADRFPVLSETFVAAEARELAALGHPVAVVTGARGDGPLEPDLPVHVLGAAPRAWVEVLARHPLRCLRDRLDRGRWAREEPPRRLRELAPAVRALDRRPDAVAHAHFAAGAALDALRAARIAGRPFTLTAHAYDIYAEPRNLREKVRAAAVVTSGCAYTVRDLRRIAGPDAAGRVHEVVMGVDLDSFRRRAPQPSGAIVLAVGRLVAKKGFDHLLRAAAEPVLRERLQRLRIIGDGPERARLEALVAELGLSDTVDLAGARPPAAVRQALEEAAVLAVPSVVAPDGDRDSMPVVAKEALAMEVPVVASDEAGLPELVRPPFGRLVPPGDHRALAAALSAVLALPAAERSAMGRSGREHVARHADVRTETARLSRLLADARMTPTSTL